MEIELLLIIMEVPKKVGEKWKQSKNNGIINSILFN